MLNWRRSPKMGSLGYRRYEEHDDPTLIYFSDGKVKVAELEVAE